MRTLALGTGICSLFTTTLFSLAVAVGVYWPTSAHAQLSRHPGDTAPPFPHIGVFGPTVPVFSCGMIADITYEGCKQAAHDEYIDCLKPLSPDDAALILLNRNSIFGGLHKCAEELGADSCAAVALAVGCNTALQFRLRMCNEQRSIFILRYCPWLSEPASVAPSVAPEY